MHVAFDGAGSGGTDAGSHEDGANKGSDGDGRGGLSPGMLLLVVFGYSVLYWIHSVLILLSLNCI